MKKIYLIFAIVLFCLPNVSSAQQYGTPGYYGERIRSWEGGLANIWAAGKYGGTTDFSWSTNTLKSAKKQKGKIPSINIHTAIELSIDKATGKTTARWEDGSVFVGFTYYGQINGEGTITFADGSKYHGGWRSDRFHGVGTMEYADGSKYHGQWSFGKPDGQGTIIEPNGVKITLKFDEGIPRGKCIIQDVDGRLYTGRWSSGILLEKSIKPLEEKK